MKENPTTIWLLISGISALFVAIGVVMNLYRKDQIRSIREVKEIRDQSGRESKEMMDKVIEMGTKFAETAGGLKSSIEANTKATDRGAQVTDDLHKTILKTTKQI